MRKALRNGWISWILLLVFIVAGMTGCGKKEAAVVTIDGEEVGISEAVFYTRLNQQQWEQAYVETLGREFWTQSLGAEMGTFADELKRQVMETVCRIEILNAHAQDYDIELTKEEKEDVKKRVVSFLESHSEAVLEAAGATEELVEELLTRTVVADKVSAAMTADYVPQVSEEEAALGKMTYCLFSTLGTYDAAGNNTPVTAEEAAQIKTDAEAFAARTAELKDIEAAAEMSSKTCIDVYFNDGTNGGAHELVAEVLRTLNVGESAGPIKTEEGYYIIQYVRAVDEEATRENMDRLAQAKTEARFQELYQQWRDQAEIEINGEIWDTLKVDQVLFVP